MLTDEIDEVLAEYYKAVEEGRPADRAALLARHPAAAAELAEFFDGFDQFERLAAQLRSVRGGDARETTDDLERTQPPSQAGPDVGDAKEVPGYEVLGVLGRGGMGVVYKARQVSLKRLVALKMIRAGDQAREEEVARFRREAEAVARLQHPNIVQIHEVGEHRGQPYCSLEFVAGGTLAGWLAGTPQPPRQAAELARTLARAVAAAHERGIVHRDLKPANVLVTEDGTPKITDFGLAKTLDEDAGQTSTGAIMGTPAYMAPEQALGQGKEVGPAADVYALGVILYEMLTGRPPFKAATVLETLEQVRNQEPVAVRLLQPKVSRDLETVCLKCLRKETAKRYDSAGALADDLGRWLEGRPVQARRSRAWERGYRLVRRNPLVSALAGLAAVLFLGGFAGVAWQWQKTRAALSEAKGSLYLQQVNLADRESDAGNPDGADVLLELCPEELRHWEWHYLKRHCEPNWLLLKGHTSQIRSVAYSADGGQVASCGNDQTVRVWDTGTGKELYQLRGHAGWVRSVVFHPEGKRLFSASEDGAVKTWDLGDGREVSSFKNDFAYVTTFSPDGRLFGSLVDGKGMRIHDVETGGEIASIPGVMTDKHDFGFSSDGRLVAANIDSRVQIWDVRTGKRIHVLQEAAPHTYSLVFGPEGRRLYGGMRVVGSMALKVWDVTTGHEVPQALSTPLTVYAIAVSPDGRSIATGGLEGIVKVRDTAAGKDVFGSRTFDNSISSLAFRPDGQGLAVATGHELWLRAWGGQKKKGPIVVGKHDGGVSSVAFSPDGTRLVSCGENDQVKTWDVRTKALVRGLNTPAHGYSVVAFRPDGEDMLAAGRDGTVYSWNVAKGDPNPSLPIQKSQLTDVAYSPDGRRFAAVGGDREVRVWDATTGEPVLTCSGHEASVWCVRFSPDGRRLASAASDGTVRVWDARTGQEVRTLRGHISHVQSIAFHPDSRLLASASTDETVRLWDVNSGKEVVPPMRGHTAPVRGLSFSPDGRRLASASEDGTVRLWDVALGQLALSLPDQGKVRWVAFSPNGWHLATASSDGTVKLWDATPLEK